MRVQPHLPSSPFTATVIESSGAALWACSAAKRPVPPEPRIRMSVSTRRRAVFLALHQELHSQYHGYQNESDGVEQRLGIDQQNAGDQKHAAFVQRGLLEQPPLEGAAQRH